MSTWVSLISLFFPVLTWGFQISPLTGPVVDEVGLLDRASKSQLEGLLRSVNNEGRGQIQIYVIKSLDGLGIEEAAIKVADEWKLGTAKKDDGVLFLIAPNERKMRIEVGQGFEGDLTDVQSKRIIEDVVAPEFRNGNFSRGVQLGTLHIVQAVAPQYFSEGQAGVVARSSRSKSPSAAIFFLIAVFAVLFPLLFSLGRKRGPRVWAAQDYNNYWGSGSHNSWGSGGGGWSSSTRL